MFGGTHEFAVIDPREELLFARGHLFAATNMPLSRLELLITRGVPDNATHVVLCDDDDGYAEKACEILNALGYFNLSKLEGGLPAWALNGGAVFSGVNVPSKAFGEVVERELATPSISATELKAKIDSQESFLLLDARPLKEHQDYCIPGAISCPSAEMILRTGDLEEFRNKDVVVHCAGRTRAIIGAQTLIDSGLFRSVRALRNGTPAWEFEELDVERGNTSEFAKPPEPTEGALSAVRRIRKNWSIPALDRAALSDWLVGPGTRYLFDIRSVSEYEAGHIPRSYHVPGGQLLQTTEKHMPVQNARVALIDDDGIRAVTTAMWLRRLGWRNVVTHSITPDDGGLETGNSTQATIDENMWISPSDAYARSNAVFCDLRPSYTYRRGHIPGAMFLTRAEPERDYSKLPADKLLILVADDTSYAALALRDLKSAGHRSVVLQGGFEAWVADGLPIETEEQTLISRPIDTYLDPEHFDNLDIRNRENHAYLNWEIALIDHIVEEPAVRYDLAH